MAYLCPAQLLRIVSCSDEFAALNAPRFGKLRVDPGSGVPYGMRLKIHDAAGAEFSQALVMRNREASHKKLSKFL